MHTSKCQRFALINSLFAILCVADASAATPIDKNQVTVYRCTDAKGKVTIQDFACNPDSAQNVSKMARPKDSATPKPAITSANPPVILIQSNATQNLTPRRPPPDLYQCTDFEGKVREAEFYDPKPRCVPLWVQGYQTSSNACSWVEDSCLRYEGEELCKRWIAKQKQAVLNADRPSAENTDFKKAEAARLTQIVKDSCW